MKKLFLGFGLAGLFGLLAPLASYAYLPYTGPMIAGQLDVGAQGEAVSNLQAFLASNPDVYPEALVTGYYGPLTEQAVMQFQLNYNLDPVGRVGPLTLATMNRVIASGLGIDVYGPVLSNASVQSVGTSSAVISWSTSKLARGKLYYANAPLVFSYSELNFVEPSNLNGSVLSSSGTGFSQSITLTGLMPGTTYYIVPAAIDLAGNVSTGSQVSFRTNS